MTLEHLSLHPDAEEVAAYLDGSLSPEDRVRVQGHLADCGECRREVVAVRRLLRARQRPRRWYLSLGVAAAGLLLVFAPWNLIHRGREPVLREPAGSTPEAPTLIAPVGAVKAPVSLIWSSVPHADRYRVRVFDRDGTLLWETQTADTTIAVPDSVRLLPPRTYYWAIAARTGLERWMDSGFTRFIVLDDSRRRQ
jgi:hypothetical protein